MAETREYPIFTPAAERALIDLADKLAKWDDFLIHKECPYPTRVKNALQTLISGQTGEVSIAEESKALYRSIKTTLNTADKMETSEKVQIFRTATSLLEKLLVMQEKAVAVEQYAKFKGLVIQTLDRYLSPLQLAEFTEELQQLESENT